MIIKQTDGLSTQIYNDLKKKIEEFEYLPGDRLSEASLAKKYNVSRTPIKHSLSRLENDQIIFVKPQIGTFVSKIDTDHIHDFFMIRMLLEVAILDEVIEQMNDTTLSELDNNIQAQEKLLKDIEQNSTIDVSRVFWKLDNSFHKTLFRSVNKEYIWEFILSQSSQFNRFRVISASNDVEYLEKKIEEHKEIMNYVLGKKEANAKQLYSEHLFSTLDSKISDLKKEYPDYFL